MPKVDAPIAAQSSHDVIPYEGEGGPRDPCNKRVEVALKKTFGFSSYAVQASAANSPMSRAT